MKIRMGILLGLMLSTGLQAADKKDEPTAKIIGSTCGEQRIELTGTMTHKFRVKNLTDKVLTSCWAFFTSSQWVDESHRFDSCKITPVIDNEYLVELKYRFIAPTETANYTITTLSVAPDKSMATQVFEKIEDPCQVQVMGKKDLETLEIISFSATKTGALSLDYYPEVVLEAVVKSPVPLTELYASLTYNTATSKGHYTAVSLLDELSTTHRNGNTFTITRHVSTKKIGWASEKAMTELWIGSSLKAKNRALQISGIGKKFKTYLSF